MKMPILFIGHGSPMNIVADNSYTRSLAELGRRLPRPEAIAVVSAHYMTMGTCITNAAIPETIYDFYGFPAELYRVTYPCPGSPDLAARVEELTGGAVRGHDKWGIDHAAWAVLTHMYPQHDIPVVEISLDVNKSPQEHYDLGKKLAPLRDEGVLVIGSGNIVHNLSVINFADMYGPPYPWAVEFDAAVADALQKRDHGALISYEKLPHARLAVPTNEHYLPLLYTIAMQDDDDELDVTCSEIQNASISMRSFVMTQG